MKKELSMGWRRHLVLAHADWIYQMLLGTRDPRFLGLGEHAVAGLLRIEIAAQDGVTCINCHQQGMVRSVAAYAPSFAAPKPDGLHLVDMNVCTRAGCFGPTSLVQAICAATPDEDGPQVPA